MNFIFPRFSAVTGIQKVLNTCLLIGYQLYFTLLVRTNYANFHLEENHFVEHFDCRGL